MNAIAHGQNVMRRSRRRCSGSGCDKACRTSLYLGLGADRRDHQPHAWMVAAGGTVQPVSPRIAAAGDNPAVREIGSWCGRLAAALALAMEQRTGSVDAVDLFSVRDDWRRNAGGTYSFDFRIRSRRYGACNAYRVPRMGRALPGRHCSRLCVIRRDPRSVHGISRRQFTVYERRRGDPGRERALRDGA